MTIVIYLFPRLREGPHPNYIEWAAGVYQPCTVAIKQQRSIPKAIRLFLGGLKNLLSGVTTVSHHNPYEPKIFDAGFPVGWSVSGPGHSPHFSPDLVQRFKEHTARVAVPPTRGGGNLHKSRLEIHDLEKAGVLSDRTVLIHGVALDARGAKLLRLRRTFADLVSELEFFLPSDDARKRNAPGPAGYRAWNRFGIDGRVISR